MTWMLTSMGLEHHYGPATGEYSTIRIDDIAHALAQINRFTGHCKRPYSVAEHSLLCLDYARGMGLEPRLQFAVLMNDAHKAYTSDLTSPAKWHIGQAWTEFERAEATKVRQHYNILDLFTQHKALIQHIDLTALATVRRDLVVYRPGRNTAWAILDTPGAVIEPMAVRLDKPSRELMSWKEWRDQFLYRAASLVKESSGEV